MTKRNLTAAIIGHLILTAPALASTVPYPNPSPVPVPQGWAAYNDDLMQRYALAFGSDTFRPRDGVDVLDLSGKAGHMAKVAKGLSWPKAEDYRATPETHHAARPETPALRLPPGLIDSPACERAPYPWFCEAGEPPVDPPEPPAVPLPGSAWMLLAGLLSLFFVPRSKAARRRDDLVAKP